MKLVYLHYKEPFKPVEKGHGYVGTLAQTEDGSEVQCHICGNCYYNLGSHIFNAHGLKAKEYRDKFQLARMTPLCSDKASAEYKERALKRMAAMTEEERKARIALMVEAQKTAVRKPRTLTTEELNRKGICPDQLLEKIKSCATALGHTPSKFEFDTYYETGRFYQPIIRTFGSWSNAIKYAGLEKKKGKSGGIMKPYTKEILLEALREYQSVKGSVPTATDCHRGFIPSLATYIKHWGGIKAAREAAGIWG